MVVLMATLGLFCLSACEDDDTPSVNPLTAKAGNDVTIALGSSTQLNGAASADAEGMAFASAWTVTNKPAGSNPTLLSANTATPTFTPDKTGVYVVTLTISRGEWSATDEVQVTVTDAPGAVLISENITQDRVLEDIFTSDWTKVDYIVTRSIRLDAKLTIKPGVKVAFAEDALLTVSTSGTLIAEGGATEAGTIYLTGQEEQDAYWTGIMLHSANTANKLDHVQLSHAGSTPYAGNLMAGMLLKANSKISITNSRFLQNNDYGLYAESTAELLAFDHNSFSQNNGIGLALPARQVHMLGSNCSFDENNTTNAVEIHDGILNSGANLTWKALEVPYILAQDLIISAQTGLHLDAGTLLKVKSDKSISLLAGAHLHANGTASKWVQIEGLEPVAGYWRGIIIEHSGDNMSEMDYTAIKHAGSTPLIGGRKTSLNIAAGAVVSVNHSLIADGAGDGFDAYSSSADVRSFEGNTIQNHAGYPIVVSTTNVAILDYNTHFAANGKPEVRVDPTNSIQSSTETVWRGFAEGTAYLIAGVHNHLYVHSGFKLTEGVIIKFQEGISLIVNDANGHLAYLKVAGTAAKKVVLQGAKEEAGSWYGITISSNNAENNITHARILHGGKPISNSFSASVVVDNSPMGRLTITNSSIEHSAQHGISVAADKRDMLNDQNLQFTAVPASPIYVWN